MNRAVVYRLMLWLFVTSIGIVVYGSLVPLESNGTSLSEAFDQLFVSAPLSIEFRSLTDWAVNLALYFPAAFFLFGALSHRVRGAVGWIGRWLVVVLVCGSTSLLVEFGQAFVVGRVSSLLDVVRNMAGAALGPLAWTVAGPTVVRTISLAFIGHPLAVPSGLRRAAVWALVPYVPLLLFAHGLISTDFRDFSEQRAMAGAIRWLPFVYHFESGVVWSVASAIKYALVYLPAGLIGCVVGSGRRESSGPSWLGRVLVMVFVASFVMELGKLLIEGLRPDTSNVVIALSGATVGWVVARLWLGRRSGYVGTEAGTSAPAARDSDPAHFEPGAGMVMPVLAAVSGLLGLGIAATSPTWPSVLLATLAAYAFLLLRCESAWLIALPALLPVLDLTPWTGVRLLNEFDAFMAVSVAFGLWRAGRRGEESSFAWPMRTGFSLLAISYLVSLAIGLWPLQPVDHAAFTDPFSRYAALPPVKAFLSALLLVWLALQARARGADVARFFTAGMLCGLVGVSLVALWERIAYPGLLDFNREFRIAASFSSMNTGGGAVEAYLVFVMPFIAAGLAMYKGWVARVGMLGLLLLSSYALMVTYARAGYGGLAVAWLVLAVAVLLTRLRERRGIDVRLWALPAALAAVAGIVIVPVMSDRFAQSRLATVGDDWRTRVSHWSEVQGMMPRDFVTQVFGMGLGRFPETYFFQGKGASPSAPFRFQTESGNTFLRLGVGAPLYVDQVVPVEPETTYKLSFRARSASGRGEVNVLLCERTFFYSSGCESAVVLLDAQPGSWSRYEATIDAGRLGATPWYARRPVKMSLENAGGKVAVDVDEIGLAAAQGASIVANGDFERGGTRWFYSSAHNHLPWHIKNLPLELLFGQGWFGLAAFGVFLISVASLLLAGGGLFAGVVLSAFAGFLAVGVFDSLLDSPRLLTLFYMTAGVAGVALARPVPRLRSSERSVHSAVEASKAAPPQPRVLQTRPAIAASSLSWALVAGGVLLLTACGWLITKAPFVPYNVRELPNPSRPLLSLLLLAVFVYWMATVPALISVWLPRVRAGLALVAPALVVHAVIGWMLVHFAVLPESIHDVVGSPVLGWPWEWERLGRFAALMLMGSVGLGTGALLTAGLWRTGTVHAATGWTIAVMLLLPLSYWVVVLEAGTDNLVELMAAHGAVWAWGGLVSWIVLLGLNASAIAAWLARPSSTWFLVCVGLTVAAPAVGWAVLSVATSDSITYDQQTFTAMQFLLSMDRRHLAQGLELAFRYVAFHGLAVAGVALVQYPVWQLMASGREPGGMARGSKLQACHV